MVDEPGANGAFDLVDSRVESLAVLDQRAEFSMRLRRHVHCFEFIHGRHPRQFEGVVLVGLAFDVGPLPGIFVGRADEGLDSQADSQVIDPARRPTGLHDNQIDLVLFEDRCQVAAIRSGIKESVFASFESKKQHIVLNLQPRTYMNCFVLHAAFAMCRRARYSISWRKTNVT
jgi:hypothetical protein